MRTGEHDPDPDQWIAAAAHLGVALFCAPGKDRPGHSFNRTYVERRTKYGLSKKDILLRVKR